LAYHSFPILLPLRLDSQGNFITAKLTTKLVGDPGIMQIFFSGSNEEILVANLLSMLGYKNLAKPGEL